METLRNWSSAVCFAAVGCAAIRLLVPEGKTGKIYRLLVMTFFICSMITPLLNVTVDLSLDAQWLPQEIVDEQLAEKVTEQLSKQVEESVRNVAEECLGYRDTKADQIVVETNVSAEGNIYIERVIVYVDEREVSKALAARDVLEQQLQVPVTVRTDREKGEEFG